ncbi:MAG: nucleotidyl transferase AbiEii/AbiGii toxin family protein [Gammaproteobacteria bacterium]|nr:nucleotidyl transferase AbiEii/AbiGii toxin family protein [Gammaproteobacteria bacterium]
MYSQNYIDQVRLLIYCLPYLEQTPQFALKGGTAINFFLQDMPRLSTDIDLTYVLLNNRDKAITDIASGLYELGEVISKKLSPSKIQHEIGKRLKEIIRLRVLHNGTQIKIEPNFIVRGTLYPTVKRDLCKKASEFFDFPIRNVCTLSNADIYAGKICAALKRQHPRDLFDIKILFEQQNLTDEIRQAFVVYLATDSKPIHELLSPNLRDISQVYEREFANMTTVPMALNELLEVRNQLIDTLSNDLTETERYFLLSIKKGEPDWNLLPFDHLDQLPGLKWKLLNVRKMSKTKHQKMIDKLKTILKL